MSGLQECRCVVCGARYVEAAETLIAGAPYVGSCCRGKTKNDGKTSSARCVACGSSEFPCKCGTPAIKRDEGKSRLDLVPFDALLMVGHVFREGAKLYGERNWEKGMDLGKLQGAALRHLSEWGNGKSIDPQFGLPHIAHAACCCLMLLASELRGIGSDSRRP